MLDVVMWLISLENIPHKNGKTYGKINIHAYDEYAFRYSFFVNYQIIEYLFSLEKTHDTINVHANKDEVFKTVCEKNNLYLMDKLLQLESLQNKFDVHMNNDYLINLDTNNDYTKLLKNLLSMS
jgi:hypothetical protein